MLADHITEASDSRLKEDTMETESLKSGLCSDVRLVSGYLSIVKR